MIDNKNKRQLLYLNTRKYKLKGFVKNNNNKLTKENLKFQETKHIQEVINKLQNNNKKTLKDKEKLRYQEAKNKQKHIDKVIKKTQEINNKREEREEKILKEKINNLAKGITEIDIEDKNKESELSFNEVSNHFVGAKTKTKKFTQYLKVYVCILVIYISEEAYFIIDIHIYTS